MDRCPHTTRPDYPRAQCSQCLGVIPYRADSEATAERNRKTENARASWGTKAKSHWEDFITTNDTN